MSQLSGKVQREILVPQLKEILRRHGLPTSGNKAELIQRLDENFPNRAWENETSAGETEQEGNVEEDKTPLNNSILRVDAPSWHPDEMSRKVTELLERERELMAREIELLRRENELLRNSPSSTASSTTNTNIRSIGELISDFSGEEQNFKNWSKQLEILSTTYELDENATRLLLGQKLKGRALNWFHSRSEHLELPTDMLLYRMESMFGNRETKVELKKKFESRKWRNTEPFEHYYHEKIVLANKVPVPEDELVEYLIDGIPDNGIQNQARMCEFKTSSHMLKALRRISLPNGSRNYTRSTAEKNQQGPNTTRGSPSGSRCYNCNRVGHRAADCRLPAREKGSCFGCGEMGHLLPNCPKKNVTRVPKRQVTYTEMEIPEEDDYHKNVQYVMNEKCMILYTLIDSGSPVSFIKRSYVPGRIENIQNSNGVRLVGINKSPLGLLGTVEASVELSKDTKETMTLLVVPDQTMYTPVVLGRDALRLFAMNIVQTKRDPISQLEILNIMLDSDDFNPADELNINEKIMPVDKVKLKEMFTNAYLNQKRPELPAVNAELKLTLSNEKSFSTTPRRISYAEKEKLQLILDSLLEKDIIRPSDSEYASPIVLVKKKNGELRMCVDFRELNKILVRDNYPLPLIEDHLDIVGGKKYFSLIDLKDGFFHVHMAKDSCKYTSFVTPLGQFEYLRMPFGLKTAPSRFQRFVNDVFSELIRSGDVVVYMDDILIATQTIEHHLQILNRVFTLLVDNKMEMRLDKCKFLYNEIEYLGYLITEKGLSPPKTGIQAVENFPIPRGVREVQSFLGLCSYFRKFIEQFALIAKPLYSLLKKDSKFKFEEEELQAFNNLKRKLTDSPVLAVYNPKDETELHCDASAGIKFKILTDCNSLRLTLNKKEINPRIARWALELQNYDFEIEHRPGIRMMHADALSRSTNILIIPETMVSDRGSCFTSKDFEDFMNKNNIRHAKVATAFPQANGQVERVNRVLGPSLAKLTENCPGKRWYEVLEDIEYALNNTISKSVSETPSKLLFGVDQRGKTPDNLKGYIHEWTSRKPVDLNACRRNAAENNIRAQNYNKAYFDKKHKPPYTYTTGDYIMLRNFESTPGVSQKLLPKYKGPYEITKCLAGAAKLSGWPSCKGFEGLRPMRTAAEYRRPVRDAVYVYGSYVDDEEGAIEVATYPYLAAFSRAYMRLKASRDWSPKKRPPTSKNDITSRRRKDAVVVRIARTT
ncbi:uncharacterized protein LOC143364412 [Halictus rubicundus]|uniref:uncharacterized protein LOC143364412 n=1 Tax=Halictus rubicundus TaxID=77578 RepID=UPI004036669B